MSDLVTDERTRAGAQRPRFSPAIPGAKPDRLIEALKRCGGSADKRLIPTRQLREGADLAVKLADRLPKRRPWPARRLNRWSSRSVLAARFVLPFAKNPYKPRAPSILVGSLTDGAAGCSYEPVGLLGPASRKFPPSEHSSLSRRARGARRRDRGLGTEQGKGISCRCMNTSTSRARTRARSRLRN